MTEKINEIEQKINIQNKIKKTLKNVAWYNFGACFFYGFAVAETVYTPRWDIALVVVFVGFALNILSWKNMNNIEKLSKLIV